MKRIIFILLIVFAGVSAYGQLDTINIGTAANNGTGESLRSAMMKVNDQIQAWNAALMYTLSAAELSVLNGVPATLTATELGYIDGVTSAIQTQLDGKQATLVSGTNIKTINSESVLGSGDIYIGTGGTMVYPGAGIALSTGSSWTTSITNNSANWNTAYGWGNHAIAGYAPTAGPTFTGTVTLPATTSIGNVSSTELGYIDNVTSAIQTQFTGKVSVSDTSSMLTPYATTGEVALKANLASPTFTGTVTVPQPFTIGAVSMTSTAAELNVLDGIPGTLTATELGYSDGVTSAIQTQLNTKIGASDTAAMLSPYALTSELTTTTLETRIDSIVSVLGDTLNIETLLQIEFDDDTVATKAYARSVGGGVSIGDVRDEIADSLNVFRADSEELSDLVPMLVDTIPLFVFGGGGGNAGDTTIFTTSTIYGSFFNEGSDTLAVTSLRVIMLGDATDTLSVDILWDVNLNDASPTELNTNPLPVNSFTTGDEDTSFAAYKIPPDCWVWCETPGVVAGRKPTYMNAQISGYKIPRY